MPFTPKFMDLVRNLTSVQGTGPVTLGAAVAGFASLASAAAVGDQFYYCIQGVDKPTEREVGRGTMLANGTVGREAITGGLTNFTAGTKTIALVAAAEWFTRLNAGGNGGAPFDVDNRASLAATTVSPARPAFLAEAGREGVFVFEPGDRSALVTADSAQGIAVAPASDPSGASGAWVRRYDDGVSVGWFGAVADGVTNSGPAFVAALAALAARGTFGGSARLIVPAGDYYLGNTTLDITHALVIEGEGSGMVGGVPTRLRWNGGATGIRVQYNITAGDRQIVANHASGAATIIRGLHLNGGYAGAAGAWHGIDLMARAHIVDCQAYLWAGNGFNIVATAGGGAGLEGNANCFKIDHCSGYGCKNGLFLSGADANAGTIVGGDYSQNREWGVRDDSFLGNTFVGVHTAANVSGPYKTTNANARSLFLGCYSEGDQPSAQVAAPSLIIGGLHGAGTGGSSAPVLTTSGNFEMVCDAASGFAVRPAGSNAVLSIDAPTSILFFGGTAYNNCDLEIYSDAATSGYNVPAGRKHSFSVDFVTTAEVDASGINLPAAKVLRIGGSQVVGARGAAVADPAGGATIDAEARTAIAAILSRLEAHGLIGV